MIGNQKTFREFRKHIEDVNFSRSPHWFDAETMDFFQTTIETGVLPGTTRFITRDRDSTGLGAYTVREFVIENVVGEPRAVEVKTVGEFGGFVTLYDATRAALEPSDD